MKVLITGGAGFIGSSLTKKLISENFEVSILDNFSEQIHGKHALVKDIFPSSVRLIIGDVKDRTCVIIDDIVDTANTLSEAAVALKKQGAKKVVAYATHPIFSGSAIDLINKSQLDEIVITDTITLSQDAKNSKRIRQVSVAEILAETIKRISHEDSVSSLFMD